jgi:hypothetical protein
VGRHSSTDRWPFLRSVTGYAVPWVVIAALVGVAVWIAVGAVGGDPVSVGDASSETSPSAESSPAPSPTPAPTGTPGDEVARKDKKEGGGRITTPDDELVTSGILVQVLNGTGGIEGAAEMMANRLTRLGYEIYAINTGLTIDRTTVYWTTDPGKEAAISLAAHFGWDVRVAPPSLSEEVDIAVVVGPDEAG